MNIFVCGDEGGSVHFWDVRRSSRPLRQFVAHRDTTSVQLSPNYVDRNLLATAGRDRFIRIWNWSDRTDGSTDASIYSVETLAPLALIRWRPQHKYQLASCAFVGDTNIYVWDIRRPFIPFASFDDHRSVCCDMLWKDGIADSFVAASSDGVIMIHRFENAHQPLAHANDIAVDVSPSGEIIIASSDQLKVKNEALADIGKLKQGAVSPPRPNNYDPFRSWAHSSLIRCLPQEKHIGLSPDRLIYFARK
ncbi:unnamed protein product [Toxocara canis]|uniref:GATOR2 complex protein WDR24 n=1 Tax=Toxocara canis TaxID=6265 RepID=A0A183VFC4_TOXCA|nr:unnamed protein product [Toxocara canis]